MNADHSLLTGVIALQNDFIDRHQLVDAFNRWTAGQNVEFSDLLFELESITEEEKVLLSTLVDRHLAKHGGNVQDSLAATSRSSIDEVLVSLEPVTGDEIQASVDNLMSIRSEVTSEDLYLTEAWKPKANSVQDSRFRVVRPHARGGLGEVFVAHDSELNRSVALKQLRSSRADNMESRSRFVLEAEITGALEHPGIVPIYALGHYVDGRPYYAMRFIRGDSLREACNSYHKARKDRLPGGDMLALRGLLGRLIDVCDAIEYAHCRGILHRDLKPENVMLGRHGETLVVDWGLARTMEANPQAAVAEEGIIQPQSGLDSTPTLMGAAIGTPQFMSPEQADGRLDLVGPRSDVYSLGATLYSVLTGESPVPGNDVAQILNRVRRGDIASPKSICPSVNIGLNAICLKAMMLDPEHRYQRAADLAKDLQCWLGDEPITAIPDPWYSRAGRWARRHRGFVVFATLAALVMIVGLIVSLWFISRAHGREVAAHAKAEHSFRAARAAVDQYFTKVSEDTLLNQPGLQPLRNDLLHEALAYYQSFFEIHQNDSALRFDLAKAAFNVARIHEELGNPGESVKRYELATSIQRDLLARSPGDLSVIEALSDTLTAQSRLAQTGHKYGASSKFNAEAIELRQHLVQRDNENINYQRKYANSYMNKGLLHLRQGQFGLAEETLRQAQEIRLPHVDEIGAEKLRVDLAKGYYNLGTLAVQQGKFEDAKELFKDASVLLEQLAEKDPSNLRQSFLLGTCYRLLGDSYAARDQLNEATTHYQRALTRLDRLAIQNPQVIDYQLALAGLYMNLASVQIPMDEQRATGSLDSAIDILNGIELSSVTPSQQRDLAVALRTRAQLRAADQVVDSVEELERAERILAKLVNEYPSDTNYSHELARTRDLLSVLSVN